MLNYQNKTKKELIEELVALKKQINKRKNKEITLKESEKRFKNLIETSPFAIIIYVQQTNSICFVNKEAEKLTGYSQKELYTMNFWDIIHPDNFQHIKERGLSKLISDTPSRLELQIVKKQKEEKWVNFAISNIEFDGQQAIMGTAFDITEKKEAELLIHENEIRFRSLFENAPIPYLALNKKGIIISVNNAFCEEQGYNKSDIENHWIGEFTNHSEIKKLKDIIKKISQEGQISDYHLDLNTRKAETLTYSIVGNAIFDILEKKTLIHITLYNITEQNKARKALSLSEEKYKQLVSKLPDLVLVHIKGKIVFANETIVNTIGYSAKDLINTSIFDYLDDENQKVAILHMSKRLNDDESAPVYELDIKTKFNTVRNTEIRASTIEYEGEMANLVVITDITDRKRMEESLYESQRLIFTLMSNMPGMAYRSLNDATWTMEFVSDGCRELTEYDPFDLINNNKLCYGQIIHPEDFEKNQKNIFQALENKNPFQTIYRIITASGKIKWVWEKGRGVYHDKEILFIEGFITDITQLKVTELDLLRSKEQFSIMAENIQDGLTIISENKIVYMNHQAEEIFGVHFKELFEIQQGKKPKLEEKAKLNKTFDDLSFYGKGPEFLEYWIEIKNHIKRFIRNSYSSVEVNPTNTIFYIITSDLTERKLKEDEIKDKEERLRSLIDDAPLGIIYADLSGNIEYANPQMITLLGSPSIEETKEINLLTFPLLIKFGVSKNAAECIKKGNKISYETYYKSKWGKEVYISLKFSPISNYSGIQTGIMIIAEDITEQKTAEALLKKSEQKNRAIIDAIPDIIFRLSADGIFIDYKSNDKNKLLLPPEEFIGKSVFQVLPRKLAKTTMFNIKKAIQSGEVQNFDYDLFFNEKINYFELRLIKSGEEEVLAIIRDITENKIAAKEIEQLNLELIEKNKEQEQIIFVASHDLRSPLVNIQGFSKELYKAFELAKSIIYLEERINVIRERLSVLFEIDIPDSFNYIFNSTTKMDFLIAGLLKISRLGKTIPVKKDMDMNQLMQLVLSIFEFQLKEKNIEIVLNDLPPCFGDEMMINQVFSNLMDNAIKYLSPERKGKISISGYIENENAIYRVEDNGIGIQSSYYNKIFELFHQLDNARQGEGLGLAITRKIIEKHNGKIWLKSEENIGSSFYVLIPQKMKD